MPEETFRWVITGGVAIAVLCIFIMAVVSVLLYRVAAKVQLRVAGVTEKVEPLIETVRQIASDSAPKIATITTRAVEIAGNAKDISDVANDQAHRFAEVGRDIADRSKAQIARIDAVVDETVEQVHHAGDNVKAAVLKPVQEAGAVFAGVKAAVFFVCQRPPPPDCRSHHARRRNVHLMANLAIVYGLRLLPADELESFEEAKIKLKNGHTASVTMHLIEGGNEEEIKRQLLQSLDAFFDFYPEI
jgi:uncharacterized protein YoxC